MPTAIGLKGDHVPALPILRCRFFVLILSCAIGPLACASAFGADPAVASVLGQPVITTVKSDQGEQLRSQILPPLLQRFARQNQIVATPAEIAELAEQMQQSRKGGRGAAADAGAGAGNQCGSAETTKTPAQGNATAQTEVDPAAQLWAAVTVDWKVAQALYRRYGGAVIFQQSNPMEPVGALAEFLQEQERAGAFTIEDADLRDKFYSYFLHPRGPQVPTAQINYDRP